MCRQWPTGIGYVTYVVRTIYMSVIPFNLRDIYVALPLINVKKLSIYKKRVRPAIDTYKTAKIPSVT